MSGELAGLDVFEGHLLRPGEDANAALRAGGDAGRGRDIRREFRRVEQHGIGRCPRRIIAVLDPSGGRVDDLGQLVKRNDFRSRPDQFRLIAGHDTAPELIIATGANGRGGVIHVQNVAFAVGVGGVENGELLHAHRVLKLGEIAGQPHLPKLLKEPGPVEAGDPHGDGGASLIYDQRAVFGLANGERFFPQLAIFLQYADGLPGHREGPNFAVQKVTTALELQPIEIGSVWIIGSLGPAEGFREALAEHGEADPDGAIGGDPRCRELHFEIGVDVAPLQMRVTHQHRVAAGGARRRDGPFVGAVNVDRGALHALVDAGSVHEPVIVDHAQTMGQDVFHPQRKSRLRRRAEGVGMLFTPRVEPGDERREQRRKLGGLLGGPLFGPGGDAVEADPAVGVEVLFAVEFGPAAAGLGVEPQEQFGMRFHLGVAVGVEEARMVWREDMGDAVAVPEDFGALGRGREAYAAAEEGERQQECFHD